MTFGAVLFESLSTCNSAGSCRCILPGEGNQQIPKQQILPENLIPQNSMVDHPFEIAILGYAPKNTKALKDERVPEPRQKSA